MLWIELIFDPFFRVKSPVVQVLRALVHAYTTQRDRDDYNSAFEAPHIWATPTFLERLNGSWVAYYCYIMRSDSLSSEKLVLTAQRSTVGEEAV
mmetsp:Transcript_11865/g.17692  ORF Transcript_11865/g.17692 Transcript_11865/m.17692 type:complete len:94 (-) Transcript_11865:118-399(-)